MAAAARRQKIGERAERLRLAVVERERVPSGAAHQTGGAVGGRRLQRRVHFGPHRPDLAAGGHAHVHEHAVGPDPLPFDLLDPRLAVLRQHRLGQRAGGQIAVRLLLVVARHQEADERVLAAGAPGELDHGIGDVGDIGRHRRFDPGNPLLQMKLVEGGEEPELVPEHRSADIDMPLPERQVRIAGKPARARRIVDVIGHPSPGRLVGDVLEAGKPVAAALEILNVRRARRARLDVAADGRHRHFAGGVEIRIEEGTVVAFGRIDPLEHHLVLAAHPEGVVSGLLALVRAADVVALHPHARCLRQVPPQVGRARHADQRFAGERRADLRGGGVDHRRVAGDGHVLSQRGQLQHRIDRQRRSLRQHDVLADEGLESLQLELQRVLA